MSSYISSLFTSSLIFIVTFFLLRRLLWTNKPKATSFSVSDISEPAKLLVKALASVLPASTILPEDTAAFDRARSQHWDQQECEWRPSCIVRPRNVEELQSAVRILKRAYDEDTHGEDRSLFAVRSGGHSPVSGAASISGGVLIDLSLLNQVELSSDRCSVDIGPGCRWGDVSTLLDDEGLAVVGGRNSHVGVGGLLLGGGISFYSPRFGLASNNVISYQIVLANGSLIKASSSSNPDLWRALRGGSNNFGIVTRFNVRCFPSTKVWSGFLYLPSFQATKVLAGLHEIVARDPHDENAAGPLTCFTYAQKLGIQAISINLVYTQLTKNEKGWPSWFETSRFNSLFRIWSTCKPQTLTSATDELHGITQMNEREAYGTTTIKNNPATIAEAYASYTDGMAIIRRVSGIYWTLVLQPLLPAWLRKGFPNLMGLQDCPDAPLILVSYTVSWSKPQDDDLVHSTVRQSIERTEHFAVSAGMSHPYRFQNYCGEWQNPFEGYSKESLHFLQETSRKYDPDALFQEGCTGGFKIGIPKGRADSQP